MKGAIGTSPERKPGLRALQLGESQSNIPKVMLRECLEEVAFLDMVRSVESGQKLSKIAMICEQAIKVMVLVSGVESSRD